MLPGRNVIFETGPDQKRLLVMNAAVYYLDETRRLYEPGFMSVEVLTASAIKKIRDDKN